MIRIVVKNSGPENILLSAGGELVIECGEYRLYTAEDLAPKGADTPEPAAPSETPAAPAPAVEAWPPAETIAEPIAEPAAPAEPPAPPDDLPGSGGGDPAAGAAYESRKRIICPGSPLDRAVIGILPGQFGDTLRGVVLDGPCAGDETTVTAEQCEPVE
jgi:hypothetical protein